MTKIFILSGYAAGLAALVIYARRPDLLARLRRSGRRTTETEHT